MGPQSECWWDTRVDRAGNELGMGHKVGTKALPSICQSVSESC